MKLKRDTPKITISQQKNNLKKPKLALQDISNLSKGINKDEKKKTEIKVPYQKKYNGWEKLELEDKYNPMMVNEYSTEIFEYFKELEVNQILIIQIRLMPNIEELFRNINMKERESTILWLNEIHKKCECLAETFFVAVNIFDRFLCLKSIGKKKYHLLATASLLIASKVEQIHISPVSVLSIYSCYSSDDIMAAERIVLSTLEYNVTFPNPLNYIRRISKADGEGDV